MMVEISKVAIKFAGEFLFLGTIIFLEKRGWTLRPGAKKMEWGKNVCLILEHPDMTKAGEFEATTTEDIAPHENMEIIGLGDLIERNNLKYARVLVQTHSAS